MKKSILFIAIALTVISGCEKENPEPDPIACFGLSSSLVDINEIVTSFNCSKNATSYQWNDGDGNQTTILEPTFYYSEPGNYIVTLTAYSESGNKTNTTQESIQVMQMLGKVSFWLSGNPAYYETTVTIGQFSETITHYYTNGPLDCQQNGCANFTLPTGEYAFTATDGVYNWSGTVNIIANECVKFQLQ